MAKVPKLPRAQINEIRMKIRAVVKDNRELQAKVDETLEKEPPPQGKAAAREQRRKAYRDVIRKNPLLRDQVENIFDVMTTP